MDVYREGLLSKVNTETKGYESRIVALLFPILQSLVNDLSSLLNTTDKGRLDDFFTNYHYCLANPRDIIAEFFEDEFGISAPQLAERIEPTLRFHSPYLLSVVEEYAVVTASRDFQLAVSSRTDELDIKIILMQALRKIYTDEINPETGQSTIFIQKTAKWVYTTFFAGVFKNYYRDRVRELIYLYNEVKLDLTHLPPDVAPLLARRIAATT